MKIVKIKHGFISYPNNPHIAKIVAHYNEGTLELFYTDGRMQEIKIDADPYQAQFGFPVSKDGTMLFWMSWEKGIIAYHIPSGEIAWRYKTTRIFDIFVYSDYIIAGKYGEALLKFDLKTGQLLNKVKGPSLEHFWQLAAPYVMVGTIRGKTCIVNTETMEIVRAYSDKENNPFNPYKCFYFKIHKAEWKDGKMLLVGHERHPSKGTDFSHETPDPELLAQGYLGWDYVRLAECDFPVDCLNKNE